MMDYEGRVERLRGRLSEQDVDALLVTNLTNVRYLTGFSGTNGQLLITGDATLFLTDRRYEARARQIVRGADVVVYPYRLTEELPRRLTDAGVQRLGIEATTVTLAEAHDLRQAAGDVKLNPTKGLVEDLRRTKDADEIELLRRAVAQGDAAFAWILDRLTPGATEREIGLDLETYMRTEGADDVSFPAIVGSGELSAHIHHTAGDRTLEKGDLVLMDFGCRVEGYCSDLTRTVVLGGATDEQRDRYELVLAAQRAGIEAARGGAAASDVDAIARKVIADAGQGDAFGHGLGHGVGLDIHEAPTLKDFSDETLRAGDVVTIEPGVYHVGWGGIRIEDCVLVTEDGADVLTSAPKDELLEL